MALYRPKGSVLCHLRMLKDVTKGEQRHLYGVLLHNTELNAMCATCIMENGQWLVLPVRKVRDGLARIHEDDYKISI
jgi:hypothetical protein